MHRFPLRTHLNVDFKLQNRPRNYPQNNLNKIKSGKKSAQ